VENTNNYIIVETIKGFLGSPKSEHNSLNRLQWQFNCPTEKCKHDVDKFNLEYQSEKHIFNCWKCNYRGYITSLVFDYGSSSDLNRIKSILPKSNFNKKSRNTLVKTNHNLKICKLPEGYLPIGKKRNTPLYNLAWDYLVNERKVSPELIDKYEIGYTETGPRKFRIIIPSKNSFGKFNYYEARSYIKGSKVIPYIKPPSDEVAKNEIIFNEYFINWNLPVFLVEGPFDMFRVPNSIPTLGKEISELLIDLLLKNNCTVIICFDPDATEKVFEIYNILSSLGLNVFFIDLLEYNKDYVKKNLPKIRGKKKEEALNKDISKIYEDYGKTEVANALSYIKKVDLNLEIIKKLK